MIKRLVIQNFTLLCLVAAGVYMGIVLPSFQADITYISWVIAVVLAWGTILNFWFASGKVTEDVLLKYQAVLDINTYLVGLGLVGTAAGVLITFGSADIGTGDAEAVKGFTSTVFSGTKVAFHSTLVGIVASMWHSLNSRVVLTGLKLGEK